MRKYGRKDTSHNELSAAFGKFGCSVADLSSLGGGIGDALVGFGGLCILVEYKTGSKPPSARKLTSAQEKFKMNWKGGYKLVETLDHVQETVEVLRGWQASILAFHRTVLVAPPVTKGKAELKYIPAPNVTCNGHIVILEHTEHLSGSWDKTCPACIANAKAGRGD